MGRGRFPHITDEELVQSARIGSIEAFDELVLRYRAAVVFVAEQVLGSMDAAEDVAQEAFLLAFKALPSLREPAKFPGWLAAIARHRARRVARRECRIEPVAPDRIEQLLAFHSHALGVCAIEEAVRKNEAALVREVMARLPPEDQVVLYLRYFEEWPVRQIAEFLSLTVTTAQWRLHRARDVLRRGLNELEEETHEERPPTRSARSPADLPIASPDRRDGPRGEHDGKLGARRPPRGAAVQPRGEAP